MKNYSLTSIKQLLSVVLFIVCSIQCSYAQEKPEAWTHLKIKSTDLSGLVVQFTDAAWNTTGFAADMRAKSEGALTQAQFDYLKKNSNYEHWPKGFYNDFLSKYRTSDDKIFETFVAGWTALKVEYVGTMTTYVNAESQYYALLKIPAASNAEWVFQAYKKAPEVRVTSDVYLVISIDKVVTEMIDQD